MFNAEEQPFQLEFEAAHERRSVTGVRMREKIQLFAVPRDGVDGLVDEDPLSGQLHARPAGEGL